MAAAPDAAAGASIGGIDRVLTIPNALSVLRLFGVPLFLWLLLGPHADGWAILVLFVSGFTDWADGVLARRLNQTSKLGALLDPLADRLYILATLVGLVLRNIIPLWLALVIVGRDAVLTFALAVIRRYGYAPFAVHYLGKAATFCLLYAFPFLLIGEYHGTVADLARPVAWAFTIWGTALYLYAGGVYLIQAGQLVRQAHR
ncbi:MAG: CDP-alcohol phosphatidyltransferase family protein [Pseudonocardiales bacterium]|nr:CDP-alcohol phosphatidyltransferase family protein [Actinomycetota bacterium]